MKKEILNIVMANNVAKLNRRSVKLRDDSLKKKNQLEWCLGG